MRAERHRTLDAASFGWTPSGLPRTYTEAVVRGLFDIEPMFRLSLVDRLLCTTGRQERRDPGVSRKTEDQAEKKLKQRMDELAAPRLGLQPF